LAVRADQSTCFTFPSWLRLSSPEVPIKFARVLKRLIVLAQGVVCIKQVFWLWFGRSCCRRRQRAFLCMHADAPGRLRPSQTAQSPLFRANGNLVRRGSYLSNLETKMVESLGLDWAETAASYWAVRCHFCRRVIPLVSVEREHENKIVPPPQKAWSFEAHCPSCSHLGVYFLADAFTWEGAPPPEFRAHSAFVSVP